MSVYESNYWWAPVTAQKLMGIWPYTNKSYDKLMRALVYIALYVLIIPVGVRMIEEVNKNPEISIENLVGQMYLNAAVIKFTSSIIYMKKHKYIYDLIAKDWKNTTDKEEFAIMEKHARVGRKICLFYAITCVSTAAVFVSMPTFLPLIDHLSPLTNETRPLVLPFHVNYFIDQKKYYVPLMIKVYLTSPITMAVFVTYDMAFAMCVQHVCSLFEIVKLRLKIVSMLGNDDTVSEDKIYQQIVKTIILHQIVLENVKTLETTYNITWFFILILNTTAIGGGLLILLLKLNMPLDLLRYGMFFAAIFLHKYFIFLPGQKIINDSLQVFEDCYFCEWYNLPLRCKKLLEMMMIRSIRSLKLTGGKMFILSMATYASMLKAGMSYFTIFASKG